MKPKHTIGLQYKVRKLMHVIVIYLMAFIACNGKLFLEDHTRGRLFGFVDVLC